MNLHKMKGFTPYIAIIFFNAFVDLGHKILIQNTLYRTMDPSGYTIMSAIINGLILLPYILLFTPSGFIADRFAKTKVLRITALAAIPITALITVCYYAGLFWCAFSLTLLLAIQSAINSPAKYGYIKEVFGKANIANANAWVQTTAIVSILAGTFAFTLLFTFFLSHAGFNTATYSVAEARSHVLTLIAPAGFLLIIASSAEAFLTFIIPEKPAADARSQYEIPRYFSGHYLKEYLTAVRTNPIILTCIFGLAVFWAINQVLLASYGAYLKEYVPHTGELFANGSLAIGGIGIFFGALYAGRISRGFIETGIIPIAAAGISLGLLLLSHTENTLMIMLLFLGYGFFGGLLMVPLNALIQFHAKQNSLGKVLAANNFIQNAFMLCFLVLTVLATRLGLDSAVNLFILFLIALGGSVYAIKRLPQSLVRYVIFFIVSKFYKIDVYGLDHLPSTGGVLLLGNHSSYIDWALIQIASPRPVRFVMERSIYETWYLKALLKAVGVIPISRGGSKGAIESVKQALNDGEVVALFPEGYLSRNGQLGTFQKGFEKAIEGTNAIIVPFYLRGLWGTVTSYATSQYKKLSYHRWRRASMSYGTPLPTEATAAEVKQAVFNLSISAWKNFTSTLDTIAVEWLRRAKSKGNDFAIADSSGKQLSHHQAIAAVWFLARKIRPQVKNSQNIGLLLPTSLGGALANLATWTMNKTAVNLNYTASSDSVQHAITQAEIKHVITSRLFLKRLASKGFPLDELLENLTVFYLEDLLKHSKRAIVLNLLAIKLLPFFIIKPWMLKLGHRVNQVAAILFSSGSEGKPKGIELTHQNLLGNAKQVSSVANVEDSDVILASLPLFHAFGLTVTLIMPLVEGIPVVCHPDPRDAVAIGKLAYRYQATLMAGTSTFFGFYCRHKRMHPLMLKSLRLVIAGAEKLSPQVREAFKQKFGVDIYEGYGTTEVAPVASSNLPDIINPDDLHVHVANKIGTVGLPVPGTCFRVVDPETYQDLPIGDEGMVLIGGTQVMRGYLQDPEKTKQVLIHQQNTDWYVTGDKGKLDEDGFLTIVDRYSRFAKVAGEMISLASAEQTITDALKEIKELEIMTIAIPDPKKGESIVLLYNQNIKPEDLLEKLRVAKIPTLMMPSQAIYVTEIPKLGSGKSDYGSAKRLVLETLT